MRKAPIIGKAGAGNSTKSPLLVARKVMKEKEMQEKNWKDYLRDKGFWVGVLLFIISLLQMFINSPASGKEAEESARWAIKWLKRVIKFLDEESIGVKPPSKE